MCYWDETVWFFVVGRILPFAAVHIPAAVKNKKQLHFVSNVWLSASTFFFHVFGVFLFFVFIFIFFD